MRPLKPRKLINWLESQTRIMIQPRGKRTKTFFTLFTKFASNQDESTLSQLQYHKVRTFGRNTRANWNAKNSFAKIKPLFQSTDGIRSPCWKIAGRIDDFDSRWSTPKSQSSKTQSGKWKNKWTWNKLLSRRQSLCFFFSKNYSAGVLLQDVIA